MSNPPTLPLLPDYVALVRFDPPVGEAHPRARVIREDDKQAIAALFEEIKADPAKIYIVDLTGKAFCGTMRLGVLIRLQQALRSTGRILRIAADHKELLDVFRLTRLNTIMHVSGSLHEAIADALRPI